MKGFECLKHSRMTPREGLGAFSSSDKGTGYMSYHTAQMWYLYSLKTIYIIRSWWNDSLKLFVTHLLLQEAVAEIWTIRKWNQTGCAWHLPSVPGSNRIRQKRLNAVHREKMLVGVRTGDGFRNTIKGNRKKNCPGRSWGMGERAYWLSVPQVQSWEPKMVMGTLTSPKVFLTTLIPVP